MSHRRLVQPVVDACLVVLKRVGLATCEWKEHVGHGWGNVAPKRLRELAGGSTKLETQLAEAVLITEALRAAFAVKR